VRLVLFDLGTTLVDRAEGFRRWAWEFRAEHRLTAADAAWLVAADDAGRADRREFFRNVRARFGLAVSEEDLAEAYRERCPALVPPAPGVLAGLPRLRAAGWRIGVLGEGEHQLATLLCTGLSGMVDGWALAGPDGLSTSDTRLLALAADRCETTLDDGWLVSGDVSAGFAAGLRTVRVAGDRELGGAAESGLGNGPVRDEPARPGLAESSEPVRREPARTGTAKSGLGNEPVHDEPARAGSSKSSPANEPVRDEPAQTGSAELRYATTEAEPPRATAGAASSASPVQPVASPVAAAGRRQQHAGGSAAASDAGAGPATASAAETPRSADHAVPDTAAAIALLLS